MTRRLIMVLATAALVTGLVATNPANANSQDPDASASATILGQVDVRLDDDCSFEGHPKHKDGDGYPVDFVELLMSGTFDNGNGNVYEGDVVSTQTISACSVTTLPVGPIPATGIGVIDAPAGGPDFVGDNGSKCLAGDFLGGDFELTAAVATVKFSIEWQTGISGSDPCSGKAALTGIVNCTGTFTAVPSGSAGITPFDPIAGSIECTPDTNGNVKQ